MEKIETAKKDGSWTALAAIEALIISSDLVRKEAFRNYPSSKEKFEAFPRSVKRGIIEWILIAKRPQI